LSWIARALTEKEARTAPDAEDTRLRGRTYSIRFEDVWQAALRVIRQKLRGWTIVIDDDRRGRIEALATSLIRGVETEVVVTIGLDENGQTRVDAAAVTRTDVRDFGRSRRLVGRFSKKLDRELDVQPEEILDPATLPGLQESA